MAYSDTATALLDAAEKMIRETGFNAFSYHSLAKAVGIRTASIHYHFKTKADLSLALMERYLRALETRLAEIEEREETGRARIDAFVELYAEADRLGVICLCGSMASDIGTLREDVQAVVANYLESSVRWVQQQIAYGVKRDEFAPIAAPRDLAGNLVAGLQGALLVTRACGNDSALQGVRRTFWKNLGN